MRIDLTIVALLGIGLAGCGGGLVPSFDAAPATKPAPITEDNSVTTLKATDIAGTYTIDSVTFYGDLIKDCQPVVILDHSLLTQNTSTSCDFKDVQVRLDLATLYVGDSGVFTFYYSIVDDNGKATKVGAFQSGSLSGTLKMGVDSGGNPTVGFVAGETNGLLDEQEAVYTVQHDAKTLTLTNKDDTPSPHFNIVHATKN